MNADKELAFHITFGTFSSQLDLSTSNNRTADSNAPEAMSRNYRQSGGLRATPPPTAALSGGPMAYQYQYHDAAWEVTYRMACRLFDTDALDSPGTK